MSGVFTVFNCGTGHTQAEPNNTIAKLAVDCVGSKYVNDGPGVGNWLTKALGGALPLSMPSKAKGAVEAIVKYQPKKVNLVGHSRGAVLCPMIANALAEHPKAQGIQQVNMALLDPVNMSPYTAKTTQVKGRVRLGSFVAIVMENVTVNIYPHAKVDLKIEPKEETIYLHMPGTHGSGTQLITSAIGWATYLTLKWYLVKWGSPMHGSPPTPEEICEAYAKIHLESSVLYDKKGRVASRLISDDKSGGQGVKTKAAQQKIGPKRFKAIAAYYEAMADKGKAKPGQNFMNSPHFINAFHLSCFQSAFPAIYAQMTNAVQADPAAVETELQKIESDYPNIADHFRELGMI